MDLEERYDKLYRYCYMKTRHPQTAEDITQETFFRFLRTHNVGEMERHTAYLYTIARNLIQEQGEGNIVLLSTHIVSDVEHIADRILMVRDGQLIYDGEAHDTPQDLEGFYLKRFEGGGM